MTGRTITTYRGHTLKRERAGHINVFVAGGFCGGYPTMAAARRAIDAARDRVIYVRTADPNTYAPLGHPAALVR